MDQLSACVSWNDVDFPYFLETCDFSLKPACKLYAEQNVLGDDNNHQFPDDSLVWLQDDMQHSFSDIMDLQHFRSLANEVSELTFIDTAPKPAAQIARKPRQRDSPKTKKTSTTQTKTKHCKQHQANHKKVRLTFHRRPGEANDTLRGAVWLARFAANLTLVNISKISGIPQRTLRRYVAWSCRKESASFNLDFGLPGQTSMGIYDRAFSSKLVRPQPVHDKTLAFSEAFASAPREAQQMYFLAKSRGL
jgi:hypothetical protein